MTDQPAPDAVREARARIARHLEDLHRLHLALVEDSRALKSFTTAGHALVEIELAAELMEQYRLASGAFLENLRGRYETRLPLLRRGEPAYGPKATEAPGHGPFWLAFSRLAAALRS